jgi:hypothetical protein
MKFDKFLLGLAALLVLAAPTTASAYVGPGLGVGAITAFFGAVFAVLLAIVGVVWYPIKRLFTRHRAPDPAEDAETHAKP